jgi:arginyl-tRNA synthetase
MAFVLFNFLENSIIVIRSIRKVLMKDKLVKMVTEAAESAYQNQALTSSDFPVIEMEEPKVEIHGDFSTNVAMVSAAVQKTAPRSIAEAIVAHIKDPEGLVEKMEIAGPGFINFFLKPNAWYPILKSIHEKDENYGRSDMGRGIKVQIEFVSANPTGPLHVGHGRGAAVGDTVGNLLSFSGFDVEKEYYVNDSGRQIQTLGRSVFLRCKELLGEAVEFPEDCYQGEYIRQLASEIVSQHKDNLLGQEEERAIGFCARRAAESIIKGIREDLASFGVQFDNWFSEQSLYDSGKVEAVIAAFQAAGRVYKKEGALWFKTTDFGDEKDRVVIRQNGQTTYFASDIAYHQDKFERGFDRAIDVWGADHHGYIKRVSASVEASGYDRDRFSVILVQLVNLLRGGAPVAMSTRSGEFVTLKDVIREVGVDAARFIFLTRHYESTLDFDLEVAKQKTNDNPVYYVQYVHARIASIMRKAEEREIDFSAIDDGILETLKTPEEIQLIKTMARYPEVIQHSAGLMEPHRITYFLMDLASTFHAYYNKHRVLSDDRVLSAGRLYLVVAVKKVMKNGLTLLGVGAPDRM